MKLMPRLRSRYAAMLSRLSASLRPMPPHCRHNAITSLYRSMVSGLMRMLAFTGADPMSRPRVSLLIDAYAADVDVGCSEGRKTSKVGPYCAR